jgi:hypothetical protein
MSSTAIITNLVPIRVDAYSSDGSVRIIDTLLVDTTCLPISHAVHPPADGNSSRRGVLRSVSGITTAEENLSNFVSLEPLIDANATHFTELLISDAEVYGSVRSSTKSFMGGRLELLNDTKLYQQIEKQIRSQLRIALSANKITLTNGGERGGTTNNDYSNIVHIKIRLRHENILVMDEFDYDINTSGLEGCDPISIANNLVQDMKLPPDMAPLLAASIVEQIYGLNVVESLEGLTSSSSIVRQTSAALTLDPVIEGTSSDYCQFMLAN